MSDAKFLRARSPEQKRQRREEILAAAAAVLAAEGVEGISLRAVAEAAGVVKSNLYRYFESREEILAQLLVRDMAEMAEALERDLAPLAGSDDVAATARLIASAFVDRPRLCLLTSVLAVVLEANMSEAALVSVKTDLMQVAERVIGAAAAACPKLGRENWFAAGNLIFTLVAGAWPLANPAPQVRAVMERPEFADFAKDFGRDLEFAIRALLRGLAVS
jgi:AcrR family transcriptional regulator